MSYQTDDERGREAGRVLREKADEIAKIWGQGWRRDDEKVEYDSHRFTRLVRDTPTGLQQVVLMFWYNDVDKLTVHARCHTDQGRYNAYLGGQSGIEARLKIHVSAKRPAKALAGDIGRRLLPVYFELWEDSAKRLANSLDYHRRRTANTERIAEALKADPAHVRGDSDGLHKVNVSYSNGVYLDANVNRETVDLDIHSVPIALAEVIGRLLAAQHQE